MKGVGACKRVREVVVDILFTTDTEIEELVTVFEAGRLPSPRWSHRAHLAVAVVYLTRDWFDTALDRARRQINKHNHARGRPGGYHETITVVHMRRIAAYLRTRTEPPTLVQAVEEVSALCSGGWLSAYYSPERLASAEARARWVEPDLAPLDDWG